MEQWPILYNLWERTSNPSASKSKEREGVETWDKEMNALYTMGLGMEETLHFLYFNRPSVEEFKGWLGRGEKIIPVNKVALESYSPDVLTARDLAFWQENGYVVLRNAIPEEQCIATQQAIWEFLDMKADDPSSWYKPHKDQRGLMLLFTQHPTLHANRESPVIRKAYEQLYASVEIYKTIDKVSFNPPETDTFHFAGSKLHWDVSLTLPIQIGLQGLLYLTDSGPQGGAFHCVPGFHKKIESWLNHLPPGVNPREEALRTLKPVAVPGKAGDFIIWHQALPHCATPNQGAVPRLVQYLTYLPIQQHIQKMWK